MRRLSFDLSSKLFNFFCIHAIINLYSEYWVVVLISFTLFFFLFGVRLYFSNIIVCSVKWSISLCRSYCFGTIVFLLAVIFICFLWFFILLTDICSLIFIVYLCCHSCRIFFLSQLHRLKEGLNGKRSKKESENDQNYDRRESHENYCSDLSPRKRCRHHYSH